MEQSCELTNTKIQYGEIHTAALAILIQAKVPLILLDARSPQWDDGRRIPGAHSLTSEAPLEKFASLIPAKESLVVVYCTNARCGASDRLAKRLKELGYLFVLKYAEGIDVWDQKL